MCPVVVFSMGGPGMFSFVTEAAGRARRMSLTKKAPKKKEKKMEEEEKQNAASSSSSIMSAKKSLRF